MLSIFKNSSIAGTVGVIELFARCRQLNDYTAQPYESFTLPSVIITLG
jgi:glutamate/aspartate transport system permease protein